MIRWFKKLLGIVETDITKIMGVFHQAKEDLAAYTDLHRAAAAAKEAEAKLASAAAAELHTLADDGEAMLKKITDFVG